MTNSWHVVAQLLYLVEYQRWTIKIKFYQFLFKKKLIIAIFLSIFGFLKQYGLTPLHVAAHYDNQQVAMMLLDKGASPHATAKVLILNWLKNIKISDAESSNTTNMYYMMVCVNLFLCRMAIHLSTLRQRRTRLRLPLRCFSMEQRQMHWPSRVWVRYTWPLRRGTQRWLPYCWRRVHTSMLALGWDLEP